MFVTDETFRYPLLSGPDEPVFDEPAGDSIGDEPGESIDIAVSSTTSDTITSSEPQKKKIRPGRCPTANQANCSGSPCKKKPANCSGSPCKKPAACLKKPAAVLKKPAAKKPVAWGSTE